jgi:hypothetical protein
MLLQTAGLAQSLVEIAQPHHIKRTSLDTLLQRSDNATFSHFLKGEFFISVQNPACKRFGAPI